MIEDSVINRPSRALWIAFKKGNTPFEDCPVALRKREQTSPEYKKINRFGKVPCIVDGDIHLSESVAISRYLANKGQLNPSLYPKDIIQQARIDEFLDWHHIGLRVGCSTYFMQLWLLPMNGLAHPPSAEKTAKLLQEMENSLKIVENIWLKNTKFVTGENLTMADLIGACEIEQTRLTQYDVSKKFPKIANWLNYVRDETNPYYDEAHKFLYKKSATK